MVLFELCPNNNKKKNKKYAEYFMTCFSQVKSWQLKSSETFKNAMK